MAKTAKERQRALVERRKDLGQKVYKVWITEKEKAVIKPLVEDKLKELREKDNKK